MDLKLAFMQTLYCRKTINEFLVLILELIFKILVKADFLMRMEEKCLTSKLGHRRYVMAAYHFSCLCLFVFVQAQLEKHKQKVSR